MTTLTKTAAWHGDPALKDEVLTRLREHRAADAIIQGLYQQYDPGLAVQYRGCAIGCTLPLQETNPVPGRHEVAGPGAGWHAEVERLYGIPRPVAHLIDRIFEGLPTDEAGDFAVAVIEAVPVGADLSMVSSRLMLDILADDEYGVLQRTRDGSKARTAVETVIGLYRRQLAGDEPSTEEWKKAAAAATAAATAATAAAAYAAAAYAADAATYATYATYAADARPSHWRWTADRLIHHLTTT